MKEKTFQLPVRVFFDSHKMVTKYEHMDTEGLFNLTSEEIEQKILNHTFSDLDDRFSSFTFSYYLLPLHISFDINGSSYLIKSEDLDKVYGKNTNELHLLFQK